MIIKNNREIKTETKRVEVVVVVLRKDFRS